MTPDRSPPGASSFPRQRLEGIRVRFEAAWHNGQRPHLEDYLLDLPHDLRVAVIQELLRREFILRRQAGEELHVQDYLERFPDLADQVRSFFSQEETNLSARSAGLSPSVSSVAPGPPPAPGPSGGREQPTQLGRYRITGVLGEGGFGIAYRGYDDELRRDVAIKVPRRERLARPGDLEAYIAEARVLAGLDHPHIVRVHDVGRTDDGLCYIVSQFIDGSDLKTRIGRQRLAFVPATELVAAIAEALHYAHRKGLVHRDVKPANILLDHEDKSYLADFGLVLREEDFGKGAAFAGTPVYMSPEQARGEGHRVDGRSDVFSLGVVFYELLVGRRPFSGAKQNELLEQIATLDPRPPRQIDDAIPKELERICLKALAKRAADRYTTARDLAEDLRSWQAPASGGCQPPERSAQGADTPRSPRSAQGADTPRSPVKIVPKGLRSFDASDADFFLDLLPGPRDRDGLPDSLRFWKGRIEETDADRTFPVGLLYGPSGCGKSSLVKAGLLPRLASHVIAIYVEATPDDTEARLLKGLRKACPDLPADLIPALAALRRGQGLSAGKKVLLVLDQFEQWLHARRTDKHTVLMQALRQCDGGRVQAVVMVRDDFWLAVSRFMTDLEIDIRQGDNTALADLFDPLHARKVLAEFGKAFGRLPENLGELTREQEAFLDRAVAGLAQEGKVISVRLALFADMVRGKPWEPATLHAVGGTAGVGVTFLEETFSASTANPRHRLHQHPARAVLRALLPEQGSDIKGNMKSEAALRSACGFADRPTDFAELLRILDGELRLITPTDPEGAGAAGSAACGFALAPQGGGSAKPQAADRFYQLTHDYLVPSLREWLTRKQKETRRGRAELRLADRTASWTAKPETRHLPSAWEWLSIRLLTRTKDRTPPQRTMMRRATRHHVSRIVALLALLTLLGYGLFEGLTYLAARARVDALTSAETAEVPRLVEELQPHRRWADTLLRQPLPEDAPERQRLHTALALVPVDASQIDYLLDQLLQATPETFPVLRDALKPSKTEIGERLWRVVQDENAGPRRLRAAGALAAYQPDDARWPTVAAALVARLLAEDLFHVGRWAESLRPVRVALTPALGVVFRDRNRLESERRVVSKLLVDYAVDRSEVLADLLVDAESWQYVLLFPRLEAHRDAAVAGMKQTLARTTEPDWGDVPSSWPTADAATVRRVEQAHGMVADRFALCQSLLFAEFEELAERLRPCGYRPIRVRPYAAEGALRVAAVWTRDGRAWQMTRGLTAEEVRQQDTARQEQNHRPVDVAGYLDGDGLRHVVVWLADEPGKPRTVSLYAGVAAVQLRPTHDRLQKDGLLPLTLQAVCRPEGRVDYCGLWRKPDANPEGGAVIWDANEREYGAVRGDSSRLLSDVSLTSAGATKSPREAARESLAQAEQAAAGKPGDLNALFNRGRAYGQLGVDDKALADLNVVVAKSARFAGGYQHRAVVHARLGHAAEAKADLARFLELSESLSTKAYVEALVAAYLGEEREILNRLDKAAAERAKDADFLYDAACAYAVAAQALTHRQVRQQIAHATAAWALPTWIPLVVENQKRSEREVQQRAKLYGTRALALLKQAVSAGYDNFAHLRDDLDLEGLHGEPTFQALLQRGHLERRYALVSDRATARQSTTVQGLDPAAHLNRCQELASQGWRPAALTVAEVVAGQRPATASVWHRPLVSEARQEALTVQQANAAVALYRLGDTDPVWPLFRHRPDPGLRSHLIHRLEPLGADPAELLRWLRSEPDLSAQRALILSLGEVTDKHLPAEVRGPLVAQLLERYRDDPDPGIHGAIDWLLRPSKEGDKPRPLDWGQAEALQKIDEERKDQPPGPRRWYVNNQGQTMAIVPGPVEFLMGSPGSEPDRRDNETLHRRRIVRSFAIATKDVTVRQFQEFLRAHPEVHHYYTKKYSPEPEGPIIGVTWFEAAQYCRWLSEQDKSLTEDQYCYPTIAEIQRTANDPTGTPLKVPADYLSRRGYRLPTEAEWEYACRVGATTSRAYGNSLALLPRYAWYKDSSKDRTWPVGQKKPNDLGMFDMQGNVWQWCQEDWRPYPQSGELKATEDIKDNRDISDRNSRVLRGGAFVLPPDVVRCANRNHGRPSDRTATVGFRLARTLP